jgi:hypothetical protein
MEGKEGGKGSGKKSEGGTASYRRIVNCCSLIVDIRREMWGGYNW